LITDKERRVLVLSRKKGQAIVIGGGICVQVEQISKSRVRLLIDAPEQVPVDRGEVWLRKRKAGGLDVQSPTE
jgi:carbon storage regulator CsrA